MKHCTNDDLSAYSEAELAAYDRGVRSVLAIRCMGHRAVPLMNRNVCEEGECAVCARDGQPPIDNCAVEEGCEQFAPA